MTEPETVAAPTISGNTPFDGSTQVTITGPSGAEIRYTINGSTPTASSSLYNGAFSLSASATVKAIAIKNGVSSPVTTKTFTKSENSGGNGGSGEGGNGESSVAEPVISYDDSEITHAIVTITGPAGAEIHYTIGDENVTAASTLYTEPFRVDTTCQIYAIAILNGVSSAIAVKGISVGDE